MSDSFLKLLSGTDIRGTAMGEGNELTDPVVEAITAAFAVYISGELGKDCADLTVAVGRDCRLSGERITGAIIRTLEGAGVRVLDCGMASTPAMFMTTVMTDADCSMQVTASHHPSDKNGIKFFTAKGGFEKAQGKKVLELAAEGERPAPGRGSVEKIPFMATYAGHLRKVMTDALGGERPLEGMKIALDAGNGVGGFFASDVLAPLGADVGGSVCLEPDGSFPNHVPNPENAEAMESISRAVVESGSDLGVIFDTDVDRAACVTADGKEINRNRLVALASAIALENAPGGTIVTDSVTSDGLKYFIENDLGGRHYRYRRGYKNVIDKAIELNESGVDCPLAIETSGHAALRENYFLDDGAYLMTKIIILAARLAREDRTLGDLIAGLREPAEAMELRFRITEPDFRTAGERILARLEEATAACGFASAAPDNREGFRARLDPGHGDGWFLLRLSVHDPVMPLNIESDVPGGAEEILHIFADLLGSPEGLDVSPMTAKL